MTYLIVTPFFPLPGHWWGGYVYDQTSAIIDTGKFDRVIVLRTMPLFKTFDYECEGITVYGLPFISMPSSIFNSNCIQKKVNVLLLQKTLRRIGIKMEEVNFVHMHVSITSLFSEFFKKKNKKITTLLQHHDLDPYGINTGKFSSYRWHVNFNAHQAINNYKYVDCHLCISEACKSNLINFPNIRKGETYKSYIDKVRKYKGPNPKINNCYILYNGVNDKIFYKKELAKSKYFTIGCIGGFSEIKNQITLIKAIEWMINKGYCQVRLRLIGTGQKRQECERYVNEHSLSKFILFDETCSHEKLIDFYNSIDLFCLPSYYEGFGCVFTEAYACGIPFITCRYQGVEELLDIKDRQNFMIEDPKDYVSLANLIIRYMKEKPEFKIIGSFKISELINKYCNWLIDNYELKKI